MFIIKCPYCGEREQEEFSCGGEAHIVRPKNPSELTDDEWAEYLFIRKNNKGIQFERWNHVFGCRQWFNIARNTATDEIIKIYNMGEEAPTVKTNEPITPSGEPIIGSGNFSTLINLDKKK
jgi:heterotetrameric sarcosine oxidase delta subunit